MSELIGMLRKPGSDKEEIRKQIKTAEMGAKKIINRGKDFFVEIIRETKLDKKSSR